MIQPIHFLAGLDALDHDDADAIALVMHDEMNHCGSPLGLGKECAV